MKIKSTVLGLCYICSHFCLYAHLVLLRKGNKIMKGRCLAKADIVTGAQHLLLLHTSHLCDLLLLNQQQFSGDYWRKKKSELLVLKSVACGSHSGP